MARPTNLRELKASGWRSRTVAEELRDNLIARLAAGEAVFPGIVGFDQTVVPAIQNAILAGHSFILLGLRGQAKTRILRSLPALLDEWLPAIEGSELNEDPLAPISVPGRRIVDEKGDDTPIRWIHRDDRYREKLATPDVTISDLIGDVDPIKAATRKLEFADPEVIHYGIVPRTNRGIFAVNELPDLAARIQVGLLNILEEGDVQIRGFPIRLPMDICMVFTANPEDYTNRGSIITPLRDRISSQILTHYPRTVDDAARITEQEAWVDREGGVRVRVPAWARLAIEEVAFQARKSEFVDQKSGVSARMTISLFEVAVSNAERRAIAAGEAEATLRSSDLLAATSAVSGKIELVYDGEREGVSAVSAMLIGKALGAVFDATFPDAYGSGDAGAGDPTYDGVLAWFRGGNTVDLSDELPDRALLDRLSPIGDLADLARRHARPEDDAELAAAMEFALEGLHQRSLLARSEVVRVRQYRDMLAEMAQSLED